MPVAPVCPSLLFGFPWLVHGPCPLSNPFTFPRTTSGKRPRYHEGRVPQPRHRECKRGRWASWRLAGSLLTEHPALAPSRARRPTPFRPGNAPHPYAGKRKHEAARSAPRCPNHSSPGSQDRPQHLATPLQCPPRCAPWRPLSLHPVPLFLLCRLSELGIPVPAPAPFALRHPFATPPLVGFAPSRPQHPAHHVIASRPPSLRAASHVLRPCRTARAPGKGMPTTNK